MTKTGVEKEEKNHLLMLRISASQTLLYLWVTWVFFFLKYNWHSMLHSFQIFNMIQYLYKLGPRSRPFGWAVPSPPGTPLLSSLRPALPCGTATVHLHPSRSRGGSSSSSSKRRSRRQRWPGSPCRTVKEAARRKSATTTMVILEIIITDRVIPWKLIGSAWPITRC